MALRRAGAEVEMLSPGDTQEGFELQLSAANARLPVTSAKGNAAAQAAAAKLGLVHVTVSQLQMEAERGHQVRVRLTGLPGLPVGQDNLGENGARLEPAGNAGQVCIIVGAGPSGLAAAACLRDKGVPAVVLERGDRIAPLWHERTNEHLPKRFCELPLMEFPDDYPEYITGLQYIKYLEGYAARFEIRPVFNTTVVSAHYEDTSGLWRVSVRAADPAVGDTEYIARCLVVATGENAERVVPKIPGLGGFAGEVTHVGDCKSGEAYRGKRVLVVGSGNSAMDVARDLCGHGARPAVVARDAVHVLPLEVFGTPTLELASMLLDRWWIPLWAADKMLAVAARLVLGDLAKLGLRRPAAGPLERTGTRVRTPVFDCGALEGIRAGDIAVVPAVARFCGGKVELVDGRALDIDAVVLATGLRSNLPQAEWHGGRISGYPATAFPCGWDGQCGLYAVGFSRRSFGGASKDAVRVAEEIAGAWREREGTEPAGHRERRGCPRRLLNSDSLPSAGMSLSR